MNKKINILLTGGGTGGHIYPAIAVAQVLKNDKAIKNIYYIGCEKNMESEIARKEGLQFYSVDFSGMPRKINFNLLTWLTQLIKACLKSSYYLIKLKPDAILGTGGYVSGPVLIAANFLRIPYIVHDPDAHPGIVNRALAPYAKAVSVAFKEAGSKLKTKNLIVNGNPLRQSFKTTSKEEAQENLQLDRNKLTISIIGGSQGANSINMAILNTIKPLIEDHNCQVIHQVGRKNFDSYMEKLKTDYPNLKNNKLYNVKPFYDDMHNIFAASDIIISRAGSLSLSEICLNGTPSILVPYPYAAADHQRHNAKVMEKAGASIFVDDKECTSERLIDIILNLINNEEKLSNMRKSAKLLAKENAAENLAEILKNIGNS